MKLTKTALKIKVPDEETLAYLIEALKTTLKDNPLMDKDLAKHINDLPTPLKFKRDLSRSEQELIFETIEYLWKKMTGESFLDQQDKVPAAKPLLGSYWMIKNGVMLKGTNHYEIIKKNTTIICPLLKINGFTLQYYLSVNSNKLLKFIILNGGLRIFINKGRQGFFQISEDAYAEWGRSKIKKFDLKEKTVKVIDPRAPFNNWETGISIKL